MLKDYYLTYVRQITNDKSIYRTDLNTSELFFHACTSLISGVHV